jgi:RNA polymerase sigma-70 factor, ECF subfamily
MVPEHPKNPHHVPAVEDPVDTVWATARPRLVRRMQTILGDASIAEDVSQEALLRLAIETRAGRTPDNPGAWLWRVAFNLAMSHGRHDEVARRRSHELIRGTSHCSVEEDALDRERLASMRRAVAELRPDDRLILVLAASGHSGVEIARRIGATHGAVRARIHRLRARLKVRLLQLEAA